MHDGSIATLEEVIEYYGGGNRNSDLDVELHPLHLSAEEKADLVLFLRSLVTAPVRTSGRSPARTPSGK
jgi:cytochrome c peroxidase